MKIRGDFGKFVRTRGSLADSSYPFFFFQYGENVNSSSVAVR